jgi:hypothetical protein
MTRCIFMLSQNLEKILSLVQKTGDKMVIVPEFSDPFVIMPVDQYESLAVSKVDYSALTEEEILNRVNREISLWKQAQREIGLGTDMDFFSPRDLFSDKQSSLFSPDSAADWQLEKEELLADVKDEWLAEKKISPFSPAKDFLEPETDPWDTETDLETLEEELDEKLDLEDEEEVSAPLAYEKVPATEEKKDLPIIEAGLEEEEASEEEIKNKEKESIDEFLVEPIE